MDKINIIADQDNSSVMAQYDALQREERGYQ